MEDMGRNSAPGCAPTPLPPPHVYPDLAQGIILLAVFLVVQVSLGVVLGIAVAVSGGALSVGDPLTTGATILISAALAVLWARWRARKPIEALIPFRRFRGLLLLPLVVAVLGYGIVASEVDNATRFVLPLPKFLYELFSTLVSGGPASVFVLAVIVPVVEEVLFRGLVLRGLLAQYRPWKAVLISAAVFTIYHLNPFQFFTAFGVGLLLGWLFWKTRSLWLCVIGHALYNAQIWFVAKVLDIHIPGYSGTSVQGAVEFQPPWFDLLGCALLAAGVAVLAWMLREKEELLDLRPFAVGGGACHEVERDGEDGGDE